MGFDEPGETRLDNQGTAPSDRAPEVPRREWRTLYRAWNKPLPVCRR